MLWCKASRACCAALLGIAGTAGLTLSLATAAAAATEPRCPDPPSLADQKLCQEIRSLKLANDRQDSLEQRALDFAPFVTVILAVAGFVLAWRKQISDATNQRQADRAQRDAESVRRFDDTFAKTTANFAADSVSLQASAAASTLAFLKPDNKEFHPAIIDLLIANSRLSHARVVTEMIVRALGKAIKLNASSGEMGSVDGLELWLARTDLPRLDLSGVDLKNARVDIAFANLRAADLRGANLWRIRGFQVTLLHARAFGARLGEARLNGANCEEADFREATLTSATFKRANLRNAQFQGALLQSAHLERSDLRGARFKGANLNDAYLYGVTVDANARQSLTSSLDWRNSHLDDDLRAVLTELSRGSHGDGEQGAPSIGSKEPEAPFDQPSSGSP